MQRVTNKTGLKWGLNLAGMIVLGMALSACGKNMKEKFGFTKRTPDEKQVTVNQPLSMPPDYSLRPPANAPQQTLPVQAIRPSGPQPLTPGQATTQQPAPNPISAVPPGANRQPPRQQPPAQPVVTATRAPVGLGQPQPLNTVSQTQTAPKRQLTRAEQEEERKRKKAEWLAKKKAENPNYGTWKNIVGSIFD